MGSAFQTSFTWCARASIHWKKWKNFPSQIEMKTFRILFISVIKTQWLSDRKRATWIIVINAGRWAETLAHFLSLAVSANWQLFIFFSHNVLLLDAKWYSFLGFAFWLANLARRSLCILWRSVCMNRPLFALWMVRSLSCLLYLLSPSSGWGCVCQKFSIQTSVTSHLVSQLARECRSDNTFSKSLTEEQN